MSILVNEKEQLFTINTANTTYQMKVDELGILMHTYYGPSVPEVDMSYVVNRKDRGFCGNPNDAGEDRTISCDTMPQEYPCEGSGDLRATALSVRRANGVSGCDLRYAGYEIREGKYSLPDLPASYENAPGEAETLEITLADRSIGLTVKLLYGIFANHDVITRSAVVTNESDSVLTLQNAASTCIDCSSGDWDLIHFYGRHCSERNKARMPIGFEEIVIGSRRGTSSHQHNPAVVLADCGATEKTGLCIGTLLMYSGSFSIVAGKDQFGMTRLIAGIQPERFDYELVPGESFVAPESCMTLSMEGFSKMSQNFHKLINNHIVRGPWKNKRRPVLINNWEATEMDFDGEKIYSIAKKASELGVEMMVLDDGWFGDRDDDNRGLGDWFVNEKKIGSTMGELADKIRGLGMKFGIWIEPEMINESSNLYKEHPEYAFAIPGKPPVRSRNQLVLDFSRKDVVDCIFDQLAVVLDDCKADYIKMDYNRSIVEVYTATDGMQSQGKVLYNYIKGLYYFMDRILERYPDLLFEGCSGGGGRFDAGMMYYNPQIWCSDNTDAINRLNIQYGTSFIYPVSTMGAHVSAVPNMQTGRITPINTRAVVAMSGTFGYELDLNLISDKEKEKVKVQIETFKKYYDLLHNGAYYRLTDVTENHEEAAWMMVSSDKAEALVNIVTLNSFGNSMDRYVFCAGLDGKAVYRDEKTGILYAGNALMTQGLPIPKKTYVIGGHEMTGAPIEYEAFQIHLKRV